MAKPITLVTELSDADAKAFIKDQEKPVSNPKADRLIKQAKQLNISLDDL